MNNFMIPLNNLTFDILLEICDVGYCYDLDNYNYDCFSDLLSCENLDNKDKLENSAGLDNEDKFEIVKNYLSNNIEILDVITDYYDLEKSYEEDVLIIKYKGKLLGINYFSSPYNGRELASNVEFIDDLPEYEVVQTITYKEKC